MKTISMRRSNIKSSEDDFGDDILQINELYNSQGGIDAELNHELGKDLLSGRDIIDMDEIFDDDYVCLDRFLTSQMITFYGE